MKRILLSFLFFSSLAFISKVNAQSCTVDQPVVSNVSSSSNGTSCTITFDLQFNFTANGGNKWKAIYIWSEADYNNLPSNFYGSNGKTVPNTSTLNGSNALAVIAINEATSPSVTLNNYPADNTEPNNLIKGVPYTSSGNFLTIEHVSVTVPNCGLQVKLVADVGSSNAQSFSNFGCLAHGLPFTANEPVIRAINNGCGGSRTVDVTFITTQPRNVFFKIFKDVAPTGEFSAADTASTNLVGGGYNTTTSWDPINLDYRSTGSYAYTVNTGERFDVWVVAYTEGVDNVGVELTSNSCAPLPVSFKAFTATKGNASTSLKWTTASESNSKGFYVQRFYNGQWTTLGFVATKAENGTSSSELNYTYSDVFNAKGVTQYRVMQIDIDGKAKYSEIRSISNGSQAGNVLVYPNPATVNGNVSIVLANAGSLYDIQIVDAAGRIVKEYNSVRSTQQVSGLSKGQYLARVIERESGQVSVEKFIMQ